MADKKGTKKFNNRNNDDDSMPRQRRIKKKVCMYCADKALVIDYKEADKLNMSSANTILKFLEEPEDDIVAILVANNRYAVIETILSRCQVLSLKNK